MKRILVLSFAAFVFRILVPIAAHAQSSEITFYAGGFTGDDFISQPQILFGDPITTRYLITM